MIPLEWLRQQPDSFGECDRCHRDRPLWLDSGEPGEFSYCRDCAYALARVTLKPVKRFEAVPGWTVEEILAREG